jgi:hypothetical protein
MRRKHKERKLERKEIKEILPVVLLLIIMIRVLILVFYYYYYDFTMFIEL